MAPSRLPGAAAATAREPQVLEPPPTGPRPRWVIFGLPLGRPQFIAGALLVLFGIQCLWLCSRPFSTLERSYILQGSLQWAGGAPGINSVHSPLPSLLGAALLPSAAASRVAAASRGGFQPLSESFFVRLLARAPFLFAGLMLGCSLWYVSRRLFGNSAGYTALALYTFAPVIISRAVSVQPAVYAMWGAFGVVFTSIAVAHTLYAPREVVLWNWRRMLLLGLSIAFAVGSEFLLILLLPAAAAFLLYLAPQRRRAAGAILGAGCLLALLVLLATYSFHAGELFRNASHFSLHGFAPENLIHRLSYALLFVFLLRTPGLPVLLLASVITYFLWPRTRFFGTTAPLLVFVLLIAFALTFPNQGGFTLMVVSLPFAFVFVAGIFADLLESRVAPVALGVLVAVLGTQAAYALLGLSRM